MVTQRELRKSEKADTAPEWQQIFLRHQPNPLASQCKCQLFQTDLGINSQICTHTNWYQPKGNVLKEWLHIPEQSLDF